MAKHARVTQPTPAPTTKVAAAGVGGVAATVLLSLLDVLDAVDLPTFWDGLVASAVAFLSGYVVKSRRSDV